MILRSSSCPPRLPGTLPIQVGAPWDSGAYAAGNSATIMGWSPPTCMGWSPPNVTLALRARRTTSIRAAAPVGGDRGHLAGHPGQLRPGQLLEAGRSGAGLAAEVTTPTSTGTSLRLTTSGPPLSPPHVVSPGAPAPIISCGFQLP